jgi:hypothetical protein
MTEPDDTAAPGVSLTDLEGVRNDQLRREYWGWDGHGCVTLCRNDRHPKHRTYCPGCAGRHRVESFPADPENDPGPAPERPGRLAELVTAWREGARQGDQDAVRLLDRLKMRHQENK